METALVNSKGEQVGKLDLPQTIFGCRPQKYFLHEVITAYLAGRRKGSACAKTRAEVSGGGKKPWRQKGTGRARHGSIRSPLWKGGGVVFGPRPRKFVQSLPRRKKQIALLQSLSAQFAKGNLIVIDKLELSSHKTKELAEILKALKAGKKPMLVTLDKSENISLAGRNLKGFVYMVAKDLNAYDVLNSSKIIIGQDSLEEFSKLGSRKSK